MKEFMIFFVKIISYIELYILRKIQISRQIKNKNVLLVNSSTFQKMSLIFFLRFNINFLLPIPTLFP